MCSNNILLEEQELSKLGKGERGDKILSNNNSQANSVTHLQALGTNKNYINKHENIFRLSWSTDTAEETASVFTDREQT